MDSVADLEFFLELVTTCWMLLLVRRFDELLGCRMLEFLASCSSFWSVCFETNKLGRVVEEYVVVGFLGGWVVGFALAILESEYLCVDLEDMVAAAAATTPPSVSVGWFLREKGGILWGDGLGLCLASACLEMVDCGHVVGGGGGGGFGEVLFSGEMGLVEGGSGGGGGGGGFEGGSGGCSGAGRGFGGGGGSCVGA